MAASASAEERRPDSGHSGGTGPLLLGTLIGLTVISGLVDAVSYLGLGHVFTANMTGNVVLLGFAAAGASGFSAAACLTSLAAFLLGAAAVGRLATAVTSRRLLLFVAMTTEAVATAAAAVIAFGVSGVPAGLPRFTIIAALAFGMGVRNSTIRRLAVPDLTTTVLTMTLTGLAADSTLAGAAIRAPPGGSLPWPRCLPEPSPVRSPSCTLAPASRC